MGEQDETGDPQYTEAARVAFDAKYATLLGSNERITFVAAGPHRRTGSGWIRSVNPILTRKGDVEPVYLILVYALDGRVLPEDEQPRYIVLGEPEITRVFPDERQAELESDGEPS